MDTDRSSSGNMPAVGPVGRNVLASMDELAAARKISMRKLSAMLDAIGRGIPPLGLARTQQALRRIDVDELVALSVVLGVNPSALLFPRHVAADDIVELAPKVQQRAGITWAWADGRLALPAELVPEGTKEVVTPGDRFADFMVHARPDMARNEPDPAVDELLTLARMIERVLGAPDKTAAWEHWRDTILRRFRLAAIQLEELFARFDRDAGGAYDEQAAIARLQDASRIVPGPYVDHAPGTAERYRDGARADRDAVRDPFGERGQ